MEGCSPSSLVRLNIGGRKFTTTLSTAKHSGILSQAIQRHEDPFSPSTEFYFDRNGDLFEYILDYLRDGIWNVGSNMDKRRVMRETVHWDIIDPHLASEVTKVDSQISKVVPSDVQLMALVARTQKKSVKSVRKKEMTPEEKEAFTAMLALIGKDLKRSARSVTDTYASRMFFPSKSTIQEAGVFYREIGGQPQTAEKIPLVPDCKEAVFLPDEMLTCCLYWEKQIVWACCKHGLSLSVSYPWVGYVGLPVFPHRKQPVGPFSHTPKSTKSRRFWGCTGIQFHWSAAPKQGIVVSSVKEDD